MLGFGDGHIPSPGVIEQGLLTCIPRWSKLIFVKFRATPSSVKPQLAKVSWGEVCWELLSRTSSESSSLCAFPITLIYGTNPVLWLNELNLFLREAAHTRDGFVSQLSPRPSLAQERNAGKAIVELLLVCPVGNQSQPFASASPMALTRAFFFFFSSSPLSTLFFSMRF